MDSPSKVERELTVVRSRDGCSTWVHGRMVLVAVVKRVGWDEWCVGGR